MTLTEKFNMNLEKKNFLYFGKNYLKTKKLTETEKQKSKHIHTSTAFYFSYF